MINWLRTLFGNNEDRAGSTELSRVSFELPVLLGKLMERGAWPQAGSNVVEQEFKPLFSADLVKKIIPNEDRISLMPPPFHTIADEVYGGNEFWNTGLSNCGEIEYSKALIIADFGVGSVSPIVLYYGSENEPDIRFLKWSGNGSSVTHSWVKSHESFEKFASDLGLFN